MEKEFRSGLNRKDIIQNTDATFHNKKATSGAGNEYCCPQPPSSLNRSCRGNSSSKMHRFPQVEMRALPVRRHIRGDAMYYESSFLAFVEL